MTRPNSETYTERQARVAANSGPGDKLAYTVPEAGHALGISETSVWKLLKDGRLRKVELFGRTLIKREELQRVLDEAAEAA